LAGVLKYLAAGQEIFLLRRICQVLRLAVFVLHLYIERQGIFGKKLAKPMADLQLKINELRDKLHLMMDRL